MKKLQLLAVGLVACFAAGTAVAEDPATKQLPLTQQATEVCKTGQPDKAICPQDTSGVKNYFEGRYLSQQGSAKCGFPPFPPFGCKVGDCVCDQFGQNCHWTFVCK